MEVVAKLFNQYNFQDVRNEVLKEFYIKVQQTDKINVSLKNKYEEYLNKNNNKIISIKGFQFDYNYDNVFLSPIEESSVILIIKKIKIANFYLSYKDYSSLPKKPNIEYICGDDYLLYMINNIYKMKNPKFIMNLKKEANDENI